MLVTLAQRERERERERERRMQCLWSPALSSFFASTRGRIWCCHSWASLSSNFASVVPDLLPPNPTSLPQQLAELGLDPVSIASLLTRPISSPSLLDDLPRKFQLLFTYGFCPSQLKRLISRPGFHYFCQINYSKLVLKLNFLGESAGRVLSRSPELLTLGVSNLEGKVEYFKKLGLERHEFMVMLGLCPRVVSVKLETLQKRAAYLQDIGLDTADIHKILRRVPNVLCVRTDECLKPIMEFLESKGTRREVIIQHLALHPQFITLSAKNLADKMDFFEKLGFDKNSPRFYPTLFTLCQLRRKLLQTRFDWLLCCGFSREDAIKMVRTNPAILECSVENIGKKIEYLINVLNRDIQEVVRYPVFLGFSLENRIMPRFNVLAQWEEKGMLEGDFSLKSVLGCSNDNFRKRFVESPPRRMNRRK